MAGMKYKEIAEKYGVTLNTVKSWKTRYKWSKDGRKRCAHKNQKKVRTQKEVLSRATRTAQADHPENKKQRNYGFFFEVSSRKRPFFSIIEEMPKDPLDILWDQIQIAYAAIIRAQKIMYVQDRDR